MALRQLILQVLAFTALVAGLLALEASDLPVDLRLRSRAGVFAFTGDPESTSLQLPMSQVLALSVISALVSAAGLLVAAFLI